MTGMQVLLRIDTGLVPDKRPAKDRALAAFARVKDEYDRTAGAGAYLYESDDKGEMLGLLNRGKLERRNPENVHGRRPRAPGRRAGG